MLMKILMQVTSIILAMVCMGQAIKPGATKFDKVMYTVVSFAYVILCFVIQEVK